jgi:hypothetical protein
MSEEQINTAIAEACEIISKDQWGSLYRTLHGIVRNCPDYINDLNAMHEAEKMLTEHQWGEYERVLRLVCDGCSYYEGAGKELLHATARQRAEAFLRTLRKWEEAK